MQIMDHNGKNCKSPKSMQGLDDFAQSPKQCSQEELSYRIQDKIHKKGDEELDW